MIKVNTYKTLLERHLNPLNEERIDLSSAFIDDNGKLVKVKGHHIHYIMENHKKFDIKPFDDMGLNQERFDRLVDMCSRNDDIQDILDFIWEETDLDYDHIIAFSLRKGWVRISYSRSGGEAVAQVPDKLSNNKTMRNLVNAFLDLNIRLNANVIISIVKPENVMGGSMDVVRNIRKEFSEISGYKYWNQLVRDKRF